MLTGKKELIASQLLHTSKSNSAEPKNSSSKFNWYNWLIAKPFDWIATPLYLVCSITLFYYPHIPNIANPQIHWWQVLITVLATFFLLGIDRYEYWRFGENITIGWGCGFLLGRIIFIQIITQANPNEATYFLYVIIPFSALLYFGSRVGVVTGVATCAVIAARVYLFPNPDFVIYRPILFVSLFILSTLFVLTTAMALLHEKASRDRAEQLLIQLKQSQSQLEELAATTERNRLARDIHDSLGHYLTVINIQLSKAQAYREKKPMASEQAIENAKRLANEALQDVRESVRSLRTGQELFSLQKSLPLLVANLQSERLAIELKITGSEAGLSKQYLLVLYRVAQEGLTNIQRHSDSRSARVCLSFSPQAVQLTIEDRGKGFDLAGQSRKPAGYGLFGLRERLETIGGQLEITSELGKGTRLSATIALE
jgi:signal transduction histidine kinase